MGGGTGTGGNPCQFATMILDQPWGEVTERVRIFPPCEIKESMHRGDDVMIFVKDVRSKNWKRKRIGYIDRFPLDGFIAWDDKNKEYAWHEVGTIDVPKAQDPDLPKVRPIIRGGSEAVLAGAGSPRRFRGVPGTLPKRRRFLDWWSSKSQSNDTPDFLGQTRKGTQ